MSKKLESEVWNMERCAGCGACVTACSKRIIRFGEGENPSKKVVMKKVGLTSSRLDVCYFCEMEGVKLCELSCPRMQEDWKDGPVLGTHLVRTTGKHASDNPNEIIAYLLAGAMQSGMIDGVVMTDMDRWTLVPYPRTAQSISEIMESSGNQYIWCPTVSGLKEAVYEHRLKSLAVVGNPCMMQATTRLENSATKALDHLSKRVKLRVGTFCSGVYRPEALSDIATALKVPLHTMKGISVDQKKDKLVVHTFDGKKKEMKLSEATNLIRAGCGRCYDLLSEEADIAIGPIGGKNDHSVAIVRTAAGENALDNAVTLGMLDVKGGVDTKALEHAKDAKKKRKRAEMMDGLQILMLEALKDPSRLDEAKKRFGELYYRKGRGDPKGGQTMGKEGCGTCSLC